MAKQDPSMPFIGHFCGAAKAVTRLATKQSLVSKSLDWKEFTRAESGNEYSPKFTAELISQDRKLSKL